MRVIVIGPNLPRPEQDLGTFHVHAEGCKDAALLLRKTGASEGWVIDVESRRDVVEDIYADMIEDPADWRAYDDLHVLPCTGL